MKKLLLVMALVLAMALPAMAQVKPTAMNIVVYEDVPNNLWTCTDTVRSGSCQHCEINVPIFGCLLWVAWPLEVVQIWEEVPVTVAEVGETFRVKGTISSDTPKDIKYRLVVTLKNQVVFKTTPKADLALPGGPYEIQFDDFTFNEPGMYSFTLQAFRGTSNFNKASTKVFVPAPPGAEPALEEEPVLEEELTLEE